MSNMISFWSWNSWVSHWFFFPPMSNLNDVFIRSYAITANLWLYSNMLQILMLQKGGIITNLTTNSLIVYYWNFKIPQFGYIRNIGLKDVEFYVQTRIVTRPICYNPILVRGKPLGAFAFVRWVFCSHWSCLFELLFHQFSGVAYFYNQRHEIYA